VVTFHWALLYTMNGVATRETMTGAKEQVCIERQDKAPKVKQFMAMETGAEKEERW
jgi:hypothetical protein